MRYPLPPLDLILYVINPTQEQKFLQRVRLLEIALEQGNTDEAMREFNHMMRIYHELHSSEQPESSASAP